MEEEARAHAELEGSAGARGAVSGDAGGHEEPVPATGGESGPGARVMIAAGAVAVLVGLYVASRYSYLLFHSLAELFSIVVACSMFLIVWNARRVLRNSYLLWLGVAYLYVAGLDLVHTLAYKGMGVFQVGDETNLATQLWVAARGVESLSLLLGTLVLRRRPNAHLVLVGFGAVFVLLLASIFWWGLFPVCYVEGEGLTAFKRISEYVVCGLLAGTVVQLHRHRRRFDPAVLQMITWSIVVTMASELAFTLYVDPYGHANLVGHYLKLVSFYLIYRALVRTALVRPYTLLFRELTQTLGELERSNADLEQFARVASHDLQAPLALVADYVGLLERSHKGKLDAEADGLIAGVTEGVHRMQELVRDVLAYSRVGAGGEQFVPVACSAVVDEVVVGLEAAIGRSGGQVTCEPLPTVVGDRPQLVQLLQNLIGNALKFRGPEPPRVHVAAEPGDRGWRFAVRDNGIGIPPESQERIFAMFERLHGRGQYPGTGIGLAICKKIVERHGGRIWVESEPGQGSTFYFTLPAKES